MAEDRVRWEALKVVSSVSCNILDTRLIETMMVNWDNEDRLRKTSEEGKGNLHIL
jgi:hypothetical protein